MSTTTKEQKEQKLATHMAQLVEMTGETRTAIAAKSGFKRPNILSMILNGQTRLPLDKIHPFARAVGADPDHLARLCLEAYEPDVFKLIQSMFATAEDAVTPAEWQVIRAIREASAGADPVPTQSQLNAIKKLFKA
jgi:hypothetical protein